MAKHSITESSASYVASKRCYKQLTPWSAVPLEELIVTHPVKKFSAFYEARRFITGLYSEPVETIPEPYFFNVTQVVSSLPVFRLKFCMHF
jgi:hypothetical protein